MYYLHRDLNGGNEIIVIDMILNCVQKKDCFIKKLKHKTVFLYILIRICDSTTVSYLRS